MTAFIVLCPSHNGIKRLLVCRTSKRSVILNQSFDRVALHLRHEAVPSTTNNLERYYGHTKPTRIKRRFRSFQHAQAFLKRQMRVRTAKQGFISREHSLSLARELFPLLSMEQLKLLFTDSKLRIRLRSARSAMPCERSAGIGSSVKLS